MVVSSIILEKTYEGIPTYPSRAVIPLEKKNIATMLLSSVGRRQVCSHIGALHASSVFLPSISSFRYSK
jgi:hypothetical protein